MTEAELLLTPNELLFKRAKEAISKFDEGYYVVETGTASGTSALWLMKALSELKSDKWFFTIDPYGGKPYRIADTYHETFDYNDDLYREAIPQLYQKAKELEVKYCHWRMRSQDFIKVFPQMEFWTDGKNVSPRYCFVYLDGEHAFEPVIQELEYFYPLMRTGGVIVIDDRNLLGEEDDVRRMLSKYPGKIEFDDNVQHSHWRVYLTKT